MVAKTVRPCYDDEAHAILDVIATELRDFDDAQIKARDAFHAANNERWRGYLAARLSEKGQRL